MPGMYGKKYKVAKQAMPAGMKKDSKKKKKKTKKKK